MKDSLEDLITQLVQQAPSRDPAIVAALVGGLREIGSPLALSIARIVELVNEELVDPGIALPALASAVTTLVGGIEGRYGSREIEAARYEIDTLQPLPDLPKTTVSTTYLIPKSALRRR